MESSLPLVCKRYVLCCQLEFVHVLICFVGCGTVEAGKYERKPFIDHLYAACRIKLSSGATARVLRLIIRKPEELSALMIQDSTLHRTFIGVPFYSLSAISTGLTEVGTIPRVGLSFPLTRLQCAQYQYATMQPSILTPPGIRELCLHMQLLDLLHVVARTAYRARPRRRT